MAEIDETLEHLLVLGVVQLVNGKLTVNGTSVVPIEVTLAEFKALTSSDYAGVTVRITNVHTSSSGSGGVLLTGGSVWTLESAQIYQSTFATALTNFPAATYPGLRIQCGDVAPLLESNGTRYTPRGGQGYLFNEVNGTLASPTKTVPDGAAPQGWTFGKPKLPGNLVQAGDILWVYFSAQRHGTGSQNLVMELGTSSAVTAFTDARYYNQPLATTDLAKVEGVCKLIIEANTSMSTNGANSIQQTSGGGAGTRTSVNANLDFTVDQYFKGGLTSRGTTTETVDLLQCSCLWIPAS